MEHDALVLPCRSLDETLRFFTDQLGFRLDEIFPADAPRIAVVSRPGLVVALEQSDGGGGPRLRLGAATGAATGPGSTPDGLPVEYALPAGELPVPRAAHRLVLRRRSEGGWVSGRAGMQYRDLVPDRIGGGYIASHIRIREGGPVPDYVHHHRVRFQAIYCYRGWVRVVYEDQGPPITMRAGDCVLQPPHIRHRVLECSDGLEVVEVASPAEHITFVEHDLELPSGHRAPNREFAGQRFVFHAAAHATWSPWRLPGFEARDTGIARATRGAGAVTVARVADALDDTYAAHDAGFVLHFVLQGQATLDHDSDSLALVAGDAVVLPPGQRYRYRSAAPDFEILEVAMPGTFETTLAG